MLGKLLPVCLALWLAALSPTLAQTPSFAFSFNSGDSERMLALAPAADGHVLAFTGVTTNGQETIRLQKLDPEGKAIFDKYFDIKAIDGVIRTTDHHNVILGQKFLEGKNTLVIMKLNPMGKPVWFKTLGTAPNDPELPPMIQATPDGGFVMLRYVPFALGTTKSFDTWKPFFDLKTWEGVEPIANLVKFDARGNQQWLYRYDQFPGGRINDIAMTPDSGMVMVGEQYYKDRFKRSAFVLKIKRSGQPQWTQSFIKGERYRGIAITPAKNGYALLCNLGENNSLHVLRLDLNGKKIWEKLLVSHGAEKARIFTDESGGFFCVGKTYYGDLSLTNQKPEHAAIYVARVNEGGTIDWEKSLGPKTGYQEPVAVIAEGNRYLLGGSMGIQTQSSFDPKEALLITLERTGARHPEIPVIADVSRSPGRSRGMEPATRGIEPAARPATPPANGVSPLPYSTRDLDPADDTRNVPEPAQPIAAITPTQPTPVQPVATPAADVPAVPATAQPATSQPAFAATARVAAPVKPAPEPSVTPPTPAAVPSLPATILAPVATTVVQPSKPVVEEEKPDSPLPTKAEIASATELVATKSIQTYLESSCPECADQKPRKTEAGYTVKCDIKAAGPEPLIWQEVYFDERGNRAERITYIKDWDANFLPSKDYITLIRIRCYCQVVLKQPIVGAVQIVELFEGDKTFVVSMADGTQTAFGANGRPLTQ